MWYRIERKEYNELCKAKNASWLWIYKVKWALDRNAYLRSIVQTNRLKYHFNKEIIFHKTTDETINTKERKSYMFSYCSCHMPGTFLGHFIIFIFSKQSFNESRFSRLFIASWITRIIFTAAKLTCPCNTLRTSNSFVRSDTGVVIDSEPHRSRTCKTSLLFAPLAVRVQAGCSAFPFYTPAKPLKRLYFKYKTALIPKFKIIFFYILDIYNKM